MRRTVALVLLTVFVVPYARAPLCELGSHDHEAHADPSLAMAHEAHGDHGGAASSGVPSHSQGGDGHPAAAAFVAYASLSNADTGPDCHARMMCDVAADQVVVPENPRAERRVPANRRSAFVLDDVAAVIQGIDLPPPRRS